MMTCLVALHKELPVVEVVMARPDSPPIAKRTRASSSNANDRAKRARCVVGSPASRLMNQMAMSVRKPACFPARCLARVRWAKNKGLLRYIRARYTVIAKARAVASLRHEQLSLLPGEKGRRATRQRQAASNWSRAAFQNSFVIKKSDPSDPVKFCKIQYNLTEFQLEDVLYSKNLKNQKSAEFAD
jgi:hypothetical protein